MNIKLPTFIELYRQLIATPSISATDAKTDQSNEALINLLANWLETNMGLALLTFGEGNLTYLLPLAVEPAGYYSVDIRIRCHLMKGVGLKIPLP